mmetsp:Transcript_16005/g.35081  ORF Transcript_16005/g.35081 Transcript_16005/m.35081 type:complete len:216 (-) Transcript_16005:592-1239(-)
MRRNWGFAPLATINSPSEKETFSNSFIRASCCATLRSWKKPSSPDLPPPELSRIIALMALRWRTCITSPTSLSSEFFPRAMHVTLSMALAPAICFLVYNSPMLPRIVPACLTTVFPHRSAVWTLPSMTMNIQSPISPSRRICSPRMKVCTEQSSASRSRSCSFRALNVASMSKKPRTLEWCLLLRRSRVRRKDRSSSLQSAPCCEQLTHAVRHTL